ncbi:hypothetical protein AAT19DRAFT_15573 [Rhodotorula toruloides]|uniref:Secreted protein n=1 Tax=Rhodotorula toruloides TaxID=5286 RepID=A0A2T0A7X0_RHOTO|nr:hypothetical protein AAT19DRAFT_15573 [Rhodotorula toruloides]
MSSSCSFCWSVKTALSPLLSASLSSLADACSCGRVSGCSVARSSWPDAHQSSPDNSVARNSSPKVEKANRILSPRPRCFLPFSPSQGCCYCSAPFSSSPFAGIPLRRANDDAASPH